jgi:hypothetical protein
MTQNAWQQDVTGLFITMNVGEKKDYSLDWVDWLALTGDTLQSAAWTIDSNVTKISEVIVGNTVAKVVLQTTAAVGIFSGSCKMTTVGGFITIQPFRIRVQALP